MGGCSIHSIGSSSSDISLGIVTLVFRAFLAEQTMEQLATTLRKGGIKDILSFFPAGKKDPKALEEYFKAQGLSQVSDWYIKRQYAAVKDSTTKTIKEMLHEDDASDDVRLA